MTTHQSLALGFFIAIGLVVGVCGEHFEVTSAQQLIKLLNISEANHFDANIVLLDDLDFSDSPLTLPFGVSSDGSCMSYTGVFEGNGHTIKGLIMDNKDKQEYNKAGLFCGLEGAVFENLVIDSSCSFGGISVGALSASLTGSLTATNVTNKAAVSGNSGVGGFVGIIESIKQRLDVTFKECVNDGKITGQGSIGGFVGMIYGNKYITVIISNLTNNGNITEGSFMGGFVGYIEGNRDIAMSISNCTNNGIITVNQCAGGLIGFFSDNRGLAVNISNIVNNGLITGESGMGGFFGCMIFTSNTNMSVFNSTNNGNITGSKYVGGFAASIETTSSANFVFFDMVNCANKGNVSAENEYAGGLFLVPQNNLNNIDINLFNSINKGSVSAKLCVYGITNIITKARNVVSMGEVNASFNTFTFWESSTDVDLFFGLDGKCAKCPNEVTLFAPNTNTGFYEVFESGERVHDLLNAEVEKQNYGMFWTEELELVDYYVEPSPSPSPSMVPSSSLLSPPPPSFSSAPSFLSQSSQSGGLSGGNKHGVSLFLISVVVALAAHVQMAQ